MTDMADLIKRLERAAAVLLEMQAEKYANGDDASFLRLKNKRDGVSLALSYAREYPSQIPDGLDSIYDGPLEGQDFNVESQVGRHAR